MSFRVEPLPWDSQFLGFPVGRLLASHVPEKEWRTLRTEAYQAGWRLLYWSVAPADELSHRSAAAAHAFLADRKVRYVQNVGEEAQPLPPTVYPTTICTPALLKLAWESGLHSRFRLDPHFAPGVYERLYQQWLEKSLRGEIARVVTQHQASTAAPATGLLTVAARAGRADIGLLAVDSAMRRQGIGHQLLRAAGHYARAWHLPQLQVVTQRANQAACAFYEQEGFQLEQEEFVYHLWL